MPKITIYVPDDLKTAMDGVEDQQPNWSSLAQEAFRRECDLLVNRKKGAGRMQTAIERLRASKHKVEDAGRVAGIKAGRAWATESAEYDELERAAAFHASVSEHGVGQWNAPFGAGGWFYAAIATDDADERPEYGDVDAFWEQITGTPREPAEVYVLAFAEGAAEVWDEVSDKL